MTTETGFLDTTGARIYYEATGSGPAAVLIHAGVANLRMWDDQVAALSDAYRVITYDTRGYGRTSTDAVEFSNRADIGAVLDHLGEQQAHVVGLSRGGQIALDFTLEFPDRVRTLTVAAGGVGGYESPDEAPAELWEAAEAMYVAKNWEGLADFETAYWADGPGQSPNRVPEIRERVHEWVLTTYRAEKEEGTPQPLDPPAEQRLGDLRGSAAGDSRHARRRRNDRVDAAPGGNGPRRKPRGVRGRAHDQPRAHRPVQCAPAGALREGLDHLPRVEDAEGIEGGLDGAHDVDRISPALLLQEGSSCSTDTVLAGDRPAEGDGRAVELLAGGVGALLGVVVVAIPDERGVQVAVTGMAEGATANVVGGGDSLDGEEQLRHPGAWRPDVLHAGHAQALHGPERHAAHLAQVVGLHRIGRSVDIRGAARRCSRLRLWRAPPRPRRRAGRTR